jgi:type I restriction enzyme M protein
MSVRNLVKSIQDIMRKDAGVDGDAQRISQLCWMFFLKIIDDQDQQLELMDPGYKSPLPKKYQWRTWAADPEGITGDELLAFVNDELFPALKNLSTSGGSAERRRVVRDLFEDAYNYMKSGQLMRQVVNKIQQVDFNNLTERQHFGDIYERLLADLQSAGNAGEYYTPRAVTAFMVDRIDPQPGETIFDPSCGTGGFLTCAIRHMRDRAVKTVKDEQKMQRGLRAVEKKPLPHMLCVTNMLLHGIEDPSFVRHDNTLARPYISYTAADRVDVVLTNPPFGGKEEDGIESNFPSHFKTRETADLFLALIIRLLKPSGRAAVVLPDGTLFGEGAAAMSVVWFGGDATSCGEGLPMPSRRTLAAAIHGLRSLGAGCAPPSWLRWPATPAQLARATPLGVTVAGSHSRDDSRDGTRHGLPTEVSR